MQVRWVLALLLASSAGRPSAGGPPRCADPGAPAHGGRTNAAAGASSYDPGDEVFFHCDRQFSLDPRRFSCAVCGPDGARSRGRWPSIRCIIIFQVG